MRKWLIVFGLAWVVLGLTGCAEHRAEVEPDLQALNQPLQLFYYNDGVYNTYGQLIAEWKYMEPDGQDIEVCILDDKYVLATEYFYDNPKGILYWNRPQSVGCQLTLFDAHGRQLWELPLANTKASFKLPPSGALAKSLIYLPNLEEGKYQLLDCRGRIWLEREIEQSPKDIEYGLLGGLLLTDYFVAIDYSDFDDELQTYREYLDVYDWRGEPLPLPKEYTYLWPLEAWCWWLPPNYKGEKTKFFKAVCELPNGQWLFDVLDERGQLCLSDLQKVEYWGQGVFAVRKGFSRGLMNERGEWLYQESIFVDLED